MKATVLVDNIGEAPLKGEWGLSILIEAEDKKILLDTGASALFMQNAEKLEIDIASIDYAVLSHAHYDHADGMEDFLKANTKAMFYLSEHADANCYFKKWFFHKYIGIPQNILHQYADRIQYASGKYELTQQVYLVAHDTEHLDEIGKRNNMYVKRANKWYPDDFAHEQSLVFDRPDGLVIFNSCSHGGADNIIEEVARQFHKPVKMMIGGFHIHSYAEKDVIALAQRLKKTGVQQIYTGHCTGQKSYDVLKAQLGDMVHQLKAGLTIEF